jgi:hypothetical protein
MSGLALCYNHRMAHAGGRPLKFQSAQEIENRAEEYFNTTPIEKWTITGLAISLDTSRETLTDYQSGDYGEEFSDAVKKIKNRVEYSYELSLRSRGGSGDIFGLKNFGWKDKTETDITTKGEALNTAPDPAAAAAFAEFLKGKK